MSRFSKYWLYLILVVVSTVPRIPWLSLPLENDSGANAFLARQILAGEDLYGRFHTAHHLPGIYYTFALSFNLFGDRDIAPRLLLFFFVFATCWLIYKIAKDSLQNEFAGILAAVFYGLVSSQELFSGVTPAIEHFANLPLTITIFLFLHYLAKPASFISLFGVGFFSAISILFKIVYAAPLATAGLILFVLLWLERKTDGSSVRFFRAVLVVALGFMLPLLFTGGYYLSQGLQDRFLLVFTLGFSYFSNTALSPLVFARPFGFPLFVTAVNNMALLAFGLLGAYRFLRQAWPLHTTIQMTGLALSIWLILSFASTGIRGGGYEHYVLIVLPALSLAAGFEIAKAYERLMTNSVRQANLTAGFMTALVLVFFVAANGKLYTQFWQYKTGWGLEAQNPYLVLNKLEAASYLKENTMPEDYIYLWGNNTQLYYHAGRMPPIDILWPDYVSATGSPERIFNERTKYIILDPELPAPAWLLEGLAVNQYSFEDRVAGWDFYKRAAP